MLDCLKGVEILKDKLKKKECEWYRVIFEESKIPTKITLNRQDSKQKGTLNKDKTSSHALRERKLEGVKTLIPNYEEEAGPS